MSEHYLPWPQAITLESMKYTWKKKASTSALFPDCFLTDINPKALHSSQSHILNVYSDHVPWLWLFTFFFSVAYYISSACPRQINSLKKHWTIVKNIPFM